MLVRELLKWLSEMPSDFVVTVTDGGDYINVTNPNGDLNSSAGIYVGGEDD